MKIYKQGICFNSIAIGVKIVMMFVLLLTPVLVKSILNGEDSFSQAVLYLALCVLLVAVILTIITAISLLFKASREPNAKIDGQSLIIENESIDLLRITKATASLPSIGRRNYHSMKLILTLDNDKRKLRLIDMPSRALLKDLKRLAPNMQMLIDDKLLNLVIEPILALIIGICITLFG